MSENAPADPGGPPAARAQLAALITRCWSTQVIHAAVTLGVIDALRVDAAQAPDLARRTHTHPRATFRLLRALAALDLARQEPDGRFALTAAGELLARDAPGSLASLALHWGTRTWPGLAHLPEAVRTGEPWPHAGRAGFAALGERPAEAARFNRAMVDQTLGVARSIVESYDFARFGSILDVGGGYGALLSAVLQACPAMRGASFDLPYMQPEAEAFLAHAGLAGRAQFIGGDFFAALPAGFDAYVLKYVIHDWDDEQSITILRRCRAAAGARARVLLVEQIVPERATAHGALEPVIRADINMLAVTGGLERTLAEYDALCAAAGLERSGVATSRSGFSVIELRARRSV